MADTPTRLPQTVKIGTPLAFQISWKLDQVLQDFDVSLLTCHFRHVTDGSLGLGTVAKLSTGVFQVSLDTTGLKPGDVFFDVKRATTPAVITPTMVCELEPAETV